MLKLRWEGNWCGALRSGYQTADGVTRRYCCTKELVEKTRCFPGRLIVQPKPGNEDWPWQTDVYFSENQTVAYAVDEAVTIEDTGMYYLWFVICDPNLAAGAYTCPLLSST